MVLKIKEKNLQGFLLDTILPRSYYAARKF